MSQRITWAALVAAASTFKMLPWSVQISLWRSRWYAMALRRNRYQNFADYIGAAKYEL